MSKTTNRRTFLGTIAVTAAATGLNIPAARANSKEREPQTKFEFLTPPYLQALTPTSVSIVTITSKKALLRLEATLTDLKVVMKSDDGEVVGEYMTNKKLS